MNANFLNKFIIFEKQITTVDSYNSPIKTYTFLKESYAGVKMIGGDLLYTNGEIPYNNLEFLIRYDPDIDYSCRILYENNYYEIKQVFTIGRQDFTKIIGKVWGDE
jgi:head-tail adaptor